MAFRFKSKSTIHQCRSNFLCIEIIGSYFSRSGNDVCLLSIVSLCIVSLYLTCLSLYRELIKKENGDDEPVDESLYSLSLTVYKPLKTSQEFRCFVHQRKLIGECLF